MTGEFEAFVLPEAFCPSITIDLMIGAMLSARVLLAALIMRFLLVPETSRLSLL